MIKTILFATDLSVLTASALQHALELTKKHQAKLVITHAVEPLGDLGTALLHAYLTPDLIKILTTTGVSSMVQEVKTQIIDTLANEYIDGDVDLLRLSEVVVRAGAPVDVILEVADDFQADLIVVGSQSPGVMMSPSLGMVAHKVINNARVPVYVVPSAMPHLHER